MTAFEANGTHIRPAGISDAESLATLAHELLLFEKSLNDAMGEVMPWAASPDELRKQLLRPNTRFFVAERFGIVIGYIKVQVHGFDPGPGELGVTRWLLALAERAARAIFNFALRRPRPNVEAAGGYIAGAFVRPDERRTNIGRMLVAAAEDWLRSRGMSDCELHVLHANKEARQFWEDAGYEPLMMGLRKKID
jgi:GNAT superfamily N-acetyltransferase